MSYAKKGSKNKILVFDFDGTLIDSARIVMEEFNKECVNYNLKPYKTVEEFTVLYDHNFFESVFMLGAPKDKLYEFANKVGRALELREKEFRFFPKIKAVLSKLLKKHKIIIVTSNTSQVVKRFLDANKMAVNDIIGADKEVSKVKKIQDVKNRFPNNKVIYIGDTVGDIIEGHLAKVKVVAVAWGYHSKEKLKRAKPDFLIDSAEELLSVVEK